MPLQLKAIERLFDRLLATYGNEFVTKYGSIEAAKVKTIWAHELDAFENSLHSISWALENLPERCPNIIEFKKLCYQAPARPEAILPAPYVSPERVKAELAKLDHLRVREPAEKKDCRAWAKSILANPKGRTPAVIQMAQNAMAVA